MLNFMSALSFLFQDFTPFSRDYLYLICKNSIFFQNNKDFYIFLAKNRTFFLFFAHSTLQTGGIFIAKGHYERT